MPLKIDNTVAISLTTDFVTSYCRKDLSFIPPHIDARTFFIGPRKGQVFRGGTEVLNAWIAKHPMPDFSVSDIEASSVITSPITCEVILHYTITWHKPDGTRLVHPQILQVSWFVQQTVAGSQKDSENHDHYKVAVMHISNPDDLDERDLLYNSFGDIAISTISHKTAGSSKDTGEMPWIVIPGIGAVLNRYPMNSILWIESAEQGHQSLVHTRDRDIRCAKPISYYVEKYPGAFLRPSVRFLVNPFFIKTVKRFQIELWNGQLLRVPEKKYAAFKSAFIGFLQANREY